jgi:TRAP-type C4-dicarboxylate transport system permease small subunit
MLAGEAGWRGREHMRLLQGIRRLGDWLERGQLAITSVSIMVIVAIVAVDVFMRSVVRYPILWAQEVVMWAFMWATFMGGAAALRAESHFAMDLISARLGPVGRSALRVVFLLACAAFAWIVITDGTTFALLGIKRLSRPSGAPLIYVYACIPLSGVTMMVYTIEKLLALLVQPGHREAPAQ